MMTTHPAPAVQEEVGMVTAEIAVAMPALILLTLAMITLIATGIQQVLITHAAGAGARAAARGEDPVTAVHAVMAQSSLSVTVSEEDDLSCVTVSTHRAGHSVLHLPPAGAQACALTERKR